ncbi:NET1-associated nuclear protein 1 [Coemansia sp. 'formosensis']|nr:NET1-associated nuclear protein 1 [Coemansia sp. 'formosensis']
MAGKKSAVKTAVPSTPKANHAKQVIDRPAETMDVDAPQESGIVGSSPRRRKSKKSKKAAENTDPSNVDEAYRTVELKQVSGGTLTHEAIVFSSDSSLFFLAKDNAVAVYNVENAEMVQSIAVDNKKQGDQAATIHAIVADPDQSRRGVYTFSADSRARLWDADTGRLIRQWRLPGGVAAYVVADPLRSNAFYCGMRQAPVKNQKPNMDKMRYTISRLTLAEDGSVETEPLFKMTGTVGLCVRGDSQWVAAYAKFRVVLAQVRSNGQVVEHSWRMIERVSALAFHPGEPVLAVGDWRGRIMFWHCVDTQLLGSDPSSDRRVTRNAHHWHAHRVNTIAFAESGTTMLSGGEEGVLVLWQLVTGARAFVPRLGSDVMGVAISPDQAHYAVTLRDNTVKVLAAATRSLVASLQGLTFADSSQPTHPRLARALQPNAFTTGLVVHPTTHHVVLNGEPGHLQVYSALSDRHVVSVEIASFNRTGGSQVAARQPHVDLVQYSSDGAWMATVDSRSEQDAECYLKFWNLDPATQKYRLATRIDAPHMGGGVSALAFQPPRAGQPLLCVTTGRAEACFRVWALQTRGTDHHFWTCRSTARYREQLPRAVAFSADGSTLAVAFGGAVTLWDPATCLAPAAVLVASAQTPALSGLAFVGESSYLAAWSSTRLDMWNLLTGSVWWTLAMPLVAVTVHPRIPLLAVAAHQTHSGPLDASLLLLSPESPNPLVALPHPAGVEALAFVPSSTPKRSSYSSEKQLADPLDHNMLVVLTPTGLLNVYGAADNEPKEIVSKVSSSAVAMSSAVFANIFGKSGKTPVPAAASTTAANAHVRQAMRLVRSAVQSAYVNAPYHVLPPVSALYDQFVTAQMHPATADALVPSTSDEDEEDAVMADADIEKEASVAAVVNRPATVDDLWSEANPDFIQSICSGFQAKTS